MAEKERERERERERKRKREKEKERKREVVCCVLLSANELKVVRSRFSPQSQNAKKRKKLMKSIFFQLELINDHSSFQKLGDGIARLSFN